jgi:hypothetical protein
MSAEPRPPRLAEWVLKRVVPTGIVGESILGDLRESFARAYQSRGPVVARAHYWADVLRIARHWPGRTLMHADRRVLPNGFALDLKLGCPIRRHRIPACDREPAGRVQKRGEELSRQAAVRQRPLVWRLAHRPCAGYRRQRVVLGASRRQHGTTSSTNTTAPV